MKNPPTDRLYWSAWILLTLLVAFLCFLNLPAK
jgi:hypothetical protein